MFRKEIKYPQGYEHISLESDRSDYTPQVGERNYVEARVPHLAASEGAALSSGSIIQEGEDKEENAPPDAAENVVQENQEEEKKESSAPPEKAKM